MTIDTKARAYTLKADGREWIFTSDAVEALWAAGDPPAKTMVGLTMILSGLLKSDLQTDVKVAEGVWLRVTSQGRASRVTVAARPESDEGPQGSKREGTK